MNCGGNGVYYFGWVGVGGGGCPKLINLPISICQSKRSTTRSSEEISNVYLWQQQHPTKVVFVVQMVSEIFYFNGKILIDRLLVP